MAHSIGSSPTRILFVSDERAWPSISGYRHRTRLILSALAEIGTVTWVAAPRNRFDGGEPLEVPETLRSVIDPVLTSASTRSRAKTFGRWCTSGLPWPLAAGDWTDADAALARSLEAPVDLVWAMGLDALAAVDRVGIEAPVVVVDADLESLKLSRELAARRPGSRSKAIVARIDIGRWSRMEQAAARERSGFSVCSEEERNRLGNTAFVTANAYPTIDLAAAETEADLEDQSDEAGLLFVGSMGYEPNRQGVAWFVEAVLPLVRHQRATARLRIVGSGPPVDRDISEAPGVDVVGQVADLRPELQRAAGVVVPIQWGAGTRIKIIEAMANRVPIVSTTLGAEGLGLVGGRHLQLADDAEGFALACVRALEGGLEIDAQVDESHRMFLDVYAEPVVSHRLQHHLRELLAAAETGLRGREPRMNRPDESPRPPH